MSVETREPQGTRWQCQALFSLLTSNGICLAILVRGSYDSFQPQGSSVQIT